MTDQNQHQEGNPSQSISLQTKKKKRKKNKKRKLDDGRASAQSDTMSVKDGDSSTTTPRSITSTDNKTTALSTFRPSNGLFFTTNQDDANKLQKYIHQYYKGFVHLPRHELSPSTFHDFAKSALERLRDMNFYQYDVVTAGGKHSSRTFVKRCLVGDPGITYKYLGLRLFSHSWGSSSSDRDSHSSTSTPPALEAIRKLNRMMIDMTRRQAVAQVLGRHPTNNTISEGKDIPADIIDKIIGKHQYNLTLINYMEPTSHTSVGFKDETEFGMGKVSVSWHADSSLESNSSIGVYHCLPTQRSSKWDWRIALRPAPSSSSSSSSSSQVTTTKTAVGNPNQQQNKNGRSVTEVAPVVVDTHDGDVYFLLGDMNETHQHAVLAGSQANRISSTHRVAVTSEDTYEYILKRVKIARKRFRTQLQLLGTSTDQNDSTRQSHVDGRTIDAKVIRYCQQVLTEVEMEWIAQYWLQGAQHDKMHVWWQKPMKTLEAYWCALEGMTYHLYQHCMDQVRNDGDLVSSSSLIDVMKVMMLEFKNRQDMRHKWDERRADKIYQRRITPEYRPVARPQFDHIEVKNSTKGQQRRQLPKDLETPIVELSKLLNAVKRNKGMDKKKSHNLGSTTGSSNLDHPTKKTVGTTPSKVTHRKLHGTEGKSDDNNSSSQSTPSTKKRKKNKKKRKAVP